MKKIVLFALLFAVTATTSAFAHSQPQMNKVYICDYANYSGAARDPGLSWWEKRIGSTTGLLYTIEHFQRPDGTTWDGYKANWSNPRTDSYGFTTWEFLFKDGPLCRNTLVTPGGFTISFQGCTDGHTRWCYTE
jgi:hypothetical protein